MIFLCKLHFFVKDFTSVILSVVFIILVYNCEQLCAGKCGVVSVISLKNAADLTIVRLL